MNNKKFRSELIERYIENKATKEELFVFFEESKDESFIQLIEDYQKNTKKNKRNIVFRLGYYRIAAAVLLVFFLSWWGYDAYFLNQEAVSSKPISAYISDCKM